MRYRLGLSFLFSFVLLSFCVVPAFAVSAVPDEVPSAKAVAVGPQYAPYIGSGWITGNASGLGHVSVYVPITSSDFGVLLVMVTFVTCPVILCPVLCILIPARNTIFLVPLFLFLVIVYMMGPVINMRICGLLWRTPICMLLPFFLVRILLVILGLISSSVFWG